jgi:hypothetical protein
VKLSYADKTSATWVKLEAHLTEELSNLRLRNDADTDAVATARLRGRILQIKAILSLATEEKVVEQ